MKKYHNRANFWYSWHKNCPQEKLIFTIRVYTILVVSVIFPLGIHQLVQTQRKKYPDFSTIPTIASTKETLISTDEFVSWCFKKLQLTLAKLLKSGNGVMNVRFEYGLHTSIMWSNCSWSRLAIWCSLSDSLSPQELARNRHSVNGVQRWNLYL